MPMELPLDKACAVSPLSADASDTLERTRHAHLYLEDEPGCAVFLVEQTLFRVYRYFLKQHSTFFATMFSLPTPEAASEGALPDGESDVRPIVIPDVRAADFAQLLLLFYPRNVDTGDVVTLDDWTSVLRVAKRFVFDAHYQLAISRLAQVATPIDLIALAREYDIPGWLEDAYFLVCTREEALTLEEGLRLGMADVIRLSELRHRIWSQSSQQWGPARLSWPPEAVRQAIRSRLAK